ncbi:hypothetical protein ACFL6I_28400, partial [candidate division KSB1 bacterium]
KKIGFLQLMSSEYNLFNKDIIELYERTTYTLSVALLNQRNQEALNERVKELTCLYQIAKIAEQAYCTFDKTFHDYFLLPGNIQRLHVERSYLMVVPIPQKRSQSSLIK